MLAEDPTTTEKPEPSKVENLIEHYTKHLVDLTIQDRSGRIGHFRATRRHPFWVAGKGWKNAVDLTANDSLIDDNGEIVSVVSVAVADIQLPTYNLLIRERHTFFIIDNGVTVLVHNGLADPSDVPPASGKFDIDHRWSQTGFPELANDPSLQTPLDRNMNRGWRAQQQRQLLADERAMIAEGMTPEDARAATMGEWEDLANSVDAYPSGKLTTGEYSGVEEGPPCD